MTDLTKTISKSDEIKTLISEILQETKRQGATDAEVDVGFNKGFTVTARKGDVESVEYNQDKGIGITVYFGKRTGAASITDVRPDAIRAAVAAACNIARFTDEDPFTGLADKELLAFDYVEPKLFYPWGISVEHAIDLALKCEAIALQQDKRLLSEGIVVATTEGFHGYGNSSGFIGAFPSTRHEVSCILIAKQKDEMQRDYSYSTACDPEMLEPINTIAEKAVERT